MLDSEKTRHHFHHNLNGKYQVNIKHGYIRIMYKKKSNFKAV